MIFLHYPGCSTCKRAKSWLDKNGIQYEARYIKQDNPDYAELKDWYKRSGMPLKRFFNTSGQLYKSMALKDKLDDMSEDEQIKLLASDGMLVKRPLIISEKAILCGFKENEWDELLK